MYAILKPKHAVTNGYQICVNLCNLWIESLTI
jgi:hypothetical protein